MVLSASWKMHLLSPSTGQRMPRLPALFHRSLLQLLWTDDLSEGEDSSVSMFICALISLLVIVQCDDDGFCDVVTCSLENVQQHSVHWIQGINHWMVMAFVTASLGWIKSSDLEVWDTVSCSHFCQTLFVTSLLNSGYQNFL